MRVGTYLAPVAITFNAFSLWLHYASLIGGRSISPQLLRWFDIPLEENVPATFSTLMLAPYALLLLHTA